MDVVIFTMQGREHLFSQTVQLLPHHLLQGAAGRIIVAADGFVDVGVLDQAQPNLILMSPTRRGYIHSIIDALRQVQTELFLWIEDDWNLSQVPSDDVTRIVDAMRRNERVLQIRWSKTPTVEVSARTLGEGIVESHVGFSANPNICRTALAQAGFRHLLSTPDKGRRLGVDGFENVVSNWCDREGVICGVVDPKGEAAIQHDGYLESTGREWHMTSSLDRAPRGSGHLGPSPPAWRRLLMVPKLLYACTHLALAQLFDDAPYDLAFRVVTAGMGGREMKRFR
jgi:hypothetical protein